MSREVALHRVFVNKDNRLLKHLCKRLIYLVLEEEQVNLKVLSQGRHQIYQR